VFGVVIEGVGVGVGVIIIVVDAATVCVDTVMNTEISKTIPR
jgi:hypothetical protein